MISKLSERVYGEQPNRDYLSYLANHKKEVYKAGRELGLPRPQLLKHDYSKFAPNSFKTYRDYWFGPEGVHAQGGREHVPEWLTQKFRIESRKHKRDKNPIPLSEVSPKYRREMLADWYAVSKLTSKNPSNFPNVKD